MPSSVLIAYASPGGSTAKVAQSVAATIQKAGVSAEVLPLSEVNSLAGREAVILGAPLYIGHFPRQFHNFLRLHHEALGACTRG